MSPEEQCMNIVTEQNEAYRVDPLVETIYTDAKFNDVLMNVLVECFTIAGRACGYVEPVVMQNPTDEVLGWYCWHKCPYHECVDAPQCYSCPANI
jgi:hypothetical protein